MYRGEAARPIRSGRNCRSAIHHLFLRHSVVQIVTLGLGIFILFASQAGSGLAQAVAPSVQPVPKTMAPSAEPDPKNVGASRAQQFESLRRERGAALREIDQRNQRLRAIDKELSSLREQLGRYEASKAVSSSVGRATATAPLQAFESSSRLKVQEEFAKNKLAATEALLRGKGSTDADLAQDNEILAERAMVQDLGVRVREAEEAQKQRDQEQKASELRQKQFAEAEATAVRAFEDEKAKTQSKIADLGTEQEKLQRELTDWTSKLDDINFAAIRLIDTSDAEGSFRFNTSWLFSALVFVVILGFFWIAHSDPKVRYAIFANDSGIQFITLFSIVIAVILFGIIGVLEGKELSALLGGLSGYILGKHQSAARSPEGAGNAAHGAAAG